MSERRTPVPAPRPSRRSALLLWVIAAAGLILVSALSYPLGRALSEMDVQLQSLILNLCYYLPFVALPAFLLARREEGMFAAYRPGSISVFGTLGVISLALLGLFFTTDLTALWSILLEALGFNVRGASLPMPASTPGLMLCVLYVAVLPAVCEEFLFRGAILSAFERQGTRRAILASAVLFALLHGSLAGLPAHLLLGLILGWLVVCCDSIYAGLIYHTTHNAASIILQFAVSRGASETGEETARMLDVVGGLSGVSQLALELALMGVMMFFTLRIFRTAARLRGVSFAPSRRESLRLSERILLVVGILLAAVLYGSDIYSMLF